MPDPIDRIARGVRRVLAPNPSAFTERGTQTYIVGSGEVAVIDPGPDIDAHVDAIMAATGGETIVAILCTHTHRDHSPASRALAQASGAEIVGCAPLALEDDGPRADAAFDFDYVPDRVLADGDRIVRGDWTLTAVATPGHTSNHLCFAFAETGLLFTGDHVMGWSTTIVSPPDGDMAAYMASLEKLLRRDDVAFLPAHGVPVTEPQARLRELIAHRRAREAAILAEVDRGGATIEAMVPIVYRDVDPRLHPAAGRSMLAHLIDLEAKGRVRRDGARWARAA